MNNEIRSDDDASEGLVGQSKKFVFEQEFLEKLLYEWIRRMMFYSPFSLTKSVIQSMALEFKTGLRMNWFFPTMEWVKKFRAKYNLNAENTKGLKFGYKESKSVHVQDIIRDMLLQKNLERQIREVDPEIDPIEVDDGEAREQCEIIEVEDHKFTINKPLMTDESVITHESFIYNESIVKDEPIETDEPIVKDEPIGTDEPIVKDEPFGTDEQIVKDEPFTTDETIVKDEPIITDETIDSDEEILERPLTDEEVVYEPLDMDDEAFTMDEALFVDEMRKFDELLTAGKISVVDDISKADEQLAADSVLFSDNLSINNDEPETIPETTKTNIDQEVSNFVDFEDELPRSVCTRFGSTVVQKEVHLDSLIDIEDLIPTSVCTSYKTQEEESDDSDHTPMEDSELNEDLLVYTDVSAKELSFSQTTTTTKEKDKCVKNPTDCGASSMTKITNTVPKTATKRAAPGKSSTVIYQNIPSSIAPKHGEIEKSPWRALPNIDESSITTNLHPTEPIITSLVLSLGEKGPAHTVSAIPTAITATSPAPEIAAPKTAASKIAALATTAPVAPSPNTAATITPAPASKYRSHRHAQKILEQTQRISVSPSIPKSIGTPRTVLTITKKTSQRSGKKVLKTRDDVLKCLKLMEDFAMMKENFRLIGYIERLDKLIRTETNVDV